MLEKYQILPDEWARQDASIRDDLLTMDAVFAEEFEAVKPKPQR